MSPENAARTLEAFYNVDVSALAMQVRVPMLVMHSRGDARVPFDEGGKLAAMIPGARFVPLESRNHVLLENEAAWQPFMAEVRDFLGPASAPAAHGVHGATGEAALTGAERDVLRLVAQGLDNDAIARQLKKSEKTLCNQVSRIFDKLGVRTRAEAIVHVRDRGVSG
ncbi:MAG: LuxR C-terminal-related transcriptional regulator [Burkholderiaceae bacterium]|nr:LuxR C-terminal-related transcriptional regulator [Burkholderiaceae bacterium]